MLKDHFQRSTATLNNLRSQHFKVSEYLNKGRYRLKQKFFGKGKKHYDFDINSQEFFHEYIDDIIFEPTQIQQIFYNEIYKTLQGPITFNNKTKMKDPFIGIRKNPSEVRVALARHFHNRSVDLKYKKYQTLLRVHNMGDEQQLQVVKSRTNLMDKQIQQCLSREARLEVEDYFQISYTQGGKPVPVNENGQPIYKYLDEEDCWFSNINRDDVQAYLRNFNYRDELLSDVYWPFWYQFQYLVFSQGLQLGTSVQQEIADNQNKIKNHVIEGAKKLISKLEKGLENLSPGNLQQKQNLTNFIFNITGINNQCPVTIPLYPSIVLELLDSYHRITPAFFKHLSLNSEKQIIDVIPKLNSFCTILFKYQNQEILEGEKEIKLGLEDEVDIKKELVTMLEQQWVQKHIKIDFNRFQYKMYLKPVDWELDTYSRRLQKQVRIKNQNGYVHDFTLQQLIRTMRLTTYSDFRKIIKKRSEKVIERLSTKYSDMELSQQYANVSDQQINKEKLIQFYKSKTDELGSLFKPSLLKESTKKFFSIIIKDYIIKNPVQIEIAETLTCIKIRQLRTKTLNILNSIRCYQRNINLDLRVIDGCQFKFEMDDDFLINSNKQVVEKFERNVKDNETTMSKVQSNQGVPSIESEDFLLHGTMQKPMLYKKDKIERHYFSQSIPHLLVIDGRKKKSILYDIALEDLKLIQNRILEIGTHFINKYERIIKMRQLPQLVDRMVVLSELFELEQQYLYEKFNLIEDYYYLYENTTEPLHAHKIGKIIIEIMYEQPKIDLNSDYFRNSYEVLIETMREESKIVKLWTKMIEDQQKEKNKVFHKKFASLCEIPLTLWAYAYGDMEIKGAKTYNKLQRMNSVSSKLSKNSKSSREKNITNQLREQIRQQFGEDSDEEEPEQQQELFNIEEYDEYMLRRNMDDIFDQIVGAEAPKQAKEKDGLGVSSLGLENLTVNPRFEGGPHVLHNYLPDIKMTSHHTQKLLNFAQNVCWVANIHDLIRRLTKEGRERYGFCSTEYQLRLTKQICLKIHKILLEPVPKLERFFEFQTDDFYHETVTMDSRNFEDIMNPILDPPSALQLSIHATHEKHQNTLPNIEILQKFDINILANLVRLEKPLNSATYRQLNLSINLIELTKIKQRIWHIQHQREQIFNAYRILGSYCDVPIQKYAHCYGRSGQSEVFLATSEAKLFISNFLKRPCFNESLEQLRNFYELEQTELSLFKSSVEIAKLQMEDYIRLGFDIQKNNKNAIINRNQILLSTDKKNVKMIANRVRGHANSIASQILKTRCYLKQKLKIRTILQQKTKEVNDINLEDLILKHYLSNDTKKYNKNCQLILTQKMKRNLIRQYIKKYRMDLEHSVMNNLNFIELLKSVDTIRNYVDSLPYLSKLFIIPTQFQVLSKKTFYDQKKIKIVEQDHRNGYQNIYYIESKEQLIEDWDALINKCNTTNLQSPIPIEPFVKSTLPPASKDDLFRWMFKIPGNKVTDKQKQSLKHLLRVFEPFTGRISTSEYRYETLRKGSRNKFSDLYEKYSIILEYLQSNLMLICLQNDGDIIDSIFSIIDCKYKFEEKYPIKDEAAIYETDPLNEGQSKEAQYMKDSPLSAMFTYENRKEEFGNMLNQRMDARQYRPEKRHWAVSDEILDFVTSKVEGYGIIRHCMLQLKDQISLFAKVKPQIAIQYMKSKTENILNIFWLSLWGTYNSKNEGFVQTYVPLFLDHILTIPKQEDFQTPLSKNSRRGISRDIKSENNELEQQKIKFEKGVYELKNDFMVNKLKVIYNFLPFNLTDHMERYLHRSQQEKQINKGDTELHLLRHNWDAISDFRELITKPDKQFRLSLFAKMRQLFENGKTFLFTKFEKLEPIELLEHESKKSTYYQYLVTSEVHMIALTSFKLSKFSKSFPDNPQQFWLSFHETLQTNKQIVEINTFNIYDQLSAYQDAGKIIFSKTEQSIIAKNPKVQQVREENNKLVRTTIFAKLTIEQFKNEVLQVATRLLKAEKTPKTEGKKIQNTSLIPRVHLISSFSSPLIIERKTYISQQYKLAFVQAFINRFRNKVSRVDLLSSGYGFVITVPDLEDCVNYMNKLLFTFTQKQFRARLQTFSQYFQILIDGIRSRNQTINQQKSIIKHLQDKVKNTLEAEYLSKVSKLLEEKILIEEKLLLAQQSSNGLEHRVRKAVKHEYDLQMKSLEKENQQLRAKFENFKDLLIKLTKDTTKSNFLSLVNTFKDQISATLDKKVDLSESFRTISQTNTEKIGKNITVKEQDHKDNSKQMKTEYDQQDIQRCKIGEDIIHDPYYVTKLINKMRVFNVFKMATQIIKHESAEQKKSRQITSLHKIQDRVISQTEREAILKNQLIKAQQQLSKKSVELDRVRHTIEALQNQKAKLKILLVTKEKKIEQKERQNEEIKKKIEGKSEIIKIQSKQSVEGVEKSIQEEQFPRISTIRQQKKSVRKINREPFLTNLDERSGALSLYQKFELSNKDSTWREKCEQLYLENKKLLSELQKLKEGFSGTVTPHTRDGYSLNMRNKRTADLSEKDSSRSEKRKFTNLSFKYGVIKG